MKKSLKSALCLSPFAVGLGAASAHAASLTTAQLTPVTDALADGVTNFTTVGLIMLGVVAAIFAIKIIYSAMSKK